MLVRILHHDHCFDGAASAAFFSRFVEGAFYPDCRFAFTGMIHKAQQTFEDELFDGDENAIVDFKYSSNPRLTWWFDHHQSAFLTSADAEHFHRDRSGKKLYDPSYKSCTRFISTIARERFQFTAPDLDHLVAWADVIDGAQYPDAQTAVALGEPAMKLTLVIEGSKDAEIIPKIIGWMRTMTLDEIVERPEVQALYAPLYERHVRSIDMIRERARQDDGVVTFDLSGYDLDSYNKFIPYYLFPGSTYTVSVTPSPIRTKISVGSNPWAPQEPRHNLATICERYGGGGHARVGAISLPPGALDKARQVVEAILKELKS